MNNLAYAFIYQCDKSRFKRDMVASDQKNISKGQLLLIQSLSRAEIF